MLPVPHLHDGVLQFSRSCHQERVRGYAHRPREAPDPETRNDILQAVAAVLDTTAHEEY